MMKKNHENSNTNSRQEPVEKADEDVDKEVLQQRYAVLHRFEDWLETPMLVLGFVWLVLLVIELTGHLGPGLQFVGTAIWVVFIADFFLKLTLAPNKVTYFKENWLTVLALLVPALRVFRIARAARILQVGRATRGIRLLRVVSSVNRGMKALGAAMQRRGFGYVVLLTLIVAVTGAAGMYFFERELPQGPGFDSFGTALWWTAMLMTTLGSDYWPKSAEGRILCFMLALYAFAVFGYVTATLATFFIGRDAENEDAELASARSIAELRQEIKALRDELRERNQRDQH
ncbi:Potassium voltage-gated channel subfamily KQT; possible potassium channel, VIC family [Polaromonas sp. CG9_12]|nr:Potassium voltage-gated channel subfamily KQT; possible potassium channel, VIC family [Polaromonas sp. CG9_12]